MRTASILFFSLTLASAGAALNAQHQDLKKSARALIGRAIDIGAPLYNAGNQGACADVYALTVDALLELTGDQLPADLEKMLERGRQSAAHEKDADDRAWKLRGVLDAVIAELEKKPMQKKTMPPAAKKDVQERPDVAAALQRAIFAFDESRRDETLTEVERLVAALGPNSRTADRLQRGVLALALGDDREPPLFRALLVELRDDYRFKPLVEAPTPPGWPTPTTVGEVELKTFPQYRMAKTTMGENRSQSGPFWTLFNHIKSRDIPMTAPVQSDFDKDVATMSFLYETSQTGETGSDGKVDVVDVAPMLVAGIGIRGELDSEKLEEAIRAIKTFIAAQPNLEISGGYRTMGWNNPMIERARRFWEVQIPVVEKSKESAHR